MMLRYELGFGMALRPGAGPSRPDLLFDAMKQLQDFSMVDVKLHDVLQPGEDYPWPDDPPHPGEYVYLAAPPDVLGALSAEQSRALLERIKPERRGSFESKQPYPNGALCVPWIQGAGRLRRGPLEGIWCMPLGVLTTLAGEERGRALIQLSSQTLFPIAIAPT